MSPTDKHMINDLLSGFNGQIKVTPVTVSGTHREELPGTGVTNQLYRRKAVMIQNTSSGTVWLGDESVGYGAGFGGGDWTACSGIRVESGDMFTIDAGRARMHVFNPESYNVDIKILEVS